MDLSALVEQIADAAENNIKIRSCDFRGDDGLLRCGLCQNKSGSIIGKRKKVLT